MGADTCPPLRCTHNYYGKGRHHSGQSLHNFPPSLPCSAHHERHLQEGGELILLLDLGLGVEQPAAVAKAAVGANQDVV